MKTRTRKNAESKNKGFQEIPLSQSPAKTQTDQNGNHREVITPMVYGDGDKEGTMETRPSRGQVRQVMIETPMGNGETKENTLRINLRPEHKERTAEETRIIMAPSQERIVKEQTKGRPVEKRNLTGISIPVLQFIKSANDSKTRHKSNHHAQGMSFQGLVRMAEVWKTTNMKELALNEMENWNEEHRAHKGRKLTQRKNDDPLEMCKLNRQIKTHARPSPGGENTLEVQETRQNTEQIRVRGRKRKNESHPTTQDQLERNRPVRLEPGETVTALDLKTRRWTREATVIGGNQDGTSYRVKINGKIHTRNRRFLLKLTGTINYRRLSDLVNEDEKTEKGTIRQKKNKISRQPDVSKSSVHQKKESPGITMWENNKRKHQQCSFCNETHNDRSTYTHNERMGVTLGAAALRNPHLDNRPKRVLTDNMTNSEKLTWFEAIEKCLGDSGAKPSNPEEYKLQQWLLLDCISPKLMIMLSKDGEVGRILEGGRGLLAKLRNHILQIDTRRYEFQSSKQKQVKKFATWWERKTAMAELCNLETMSTTDFLKTHLVRGVFEKDLKKTLLDKIKNNLDGLVRLARM